MSETARFDARYGLVFTIAFVLCVAYGTGWVHGRYLGDAGQHQVLSLLPTDDGASCAMSFGDQYQLLQQLWVKVDFSKIDRIYCVNLGHGRYNVTFTLRQPSQSESGSCHDPSDSRCWLHY